MKLQEDEQLRHQYFDKIIIMSSDHVIIGDNIQSQEKLKYLLKPIKIK